MSTDIIKKETSTDIVKLDPKVVLKENTHPATFKEVTSLVHAVTNKFDSLAKIKLTYGEKLPLSIIKVWLINLNDFLNISRKMNEIQIEETADMIFTDFSYLKTSDLALIFKRIKSGFYGQFYESIDGMKIIDIFYKYGQERIDHFINNSERERLEIKNLEAR